jgi:hypothetical protein
MLGIDTLLFQHVRLWIMLLLINPVASCHSCIMVDLCWSVCFKFHNDTNQFVSLFIFRGRYYYCIMFYFIFCLILQRLLLFLFYCVSFVALYVLPLSSIYRLLALLKTQANFIVVPPVKHIWIELILFQNIFPTVS